jgi:hypothetical protein
VAKITEAQINSIIKWIQVGVNVEPIVVATVKQLRDIFASQGYDTGIFDEIEAIINDYQARADAEAAAHGHPRPPGNG